MRTIRIIGAAALVTAVGLSVPATAEAQTTRSGAAKGTIAKKAKAKAKRNVSVTPAARVHYSRPPRVVG